METNVVLWIASLVLVWKVVTRNTGLVNETNRKVDQTNKILKTILDDFKGFKNNVVRSTEIEVVAAVQLLMMQKGFELQGKPIMRKTLYDEDNMILVEVDGLIFFKRNSVCQAAIIEVKSKVKKEVLQQVKKAASVIKLRYDLSDVLIFVGGPLIEENTRGRLLKEGITVLELSGSRYQAVSPDGSVFRL